MATKIPPLSGVKDKDKILLAVKEILEIREGLRGENIPVDGYLDRFISFRDLEDLIRTNQTIYNALVAALDPYINEEIYTSYEETLCFEEDINGDLQPKEVPVEDMWFDIDANGDIQPRNCYFAWSGEIVVMG